MWQSQQRVMRDLDKYTMEGIMQANHRLSALELSPKSKSRPPVKIADWLEREVDLYQNHGLVDEETLERMADKLRKEARI